MPLLAKTEKHSFVRGAAQPLGLPLPPVYCRLTVCFITFARLIVFLAVWTVGLTVEIICPMVETVCSAI